MKYLKNISLKSLFIFASIFCLTSCIDEPDTPEIIQLISLEDYIEQNNLTPTKTASGLYYIIDELGTGEHPSATANVTVSYKGYYTNESVFNQSRTADGITFNLQEVIPGWTEGIPLFKKGGKGTLLIPSHLGYGLNPRQGVIFNADLIFDINLIDFSE